MLICGNCPGLHSSRLLDLLRYAQRQRGGKNSRNESSMKRSWPKKLAERDYELKLQLLLEAAVINVHLLTAD